MMKLVKLAIIVEDSTVVPVLFNPNQISITRVGWNGDDETGLSPTDPPATLSMDLFFDTSLPKADSSLVGAVSTALLGQSLSPSVGLPEDVRNYTKQIFNLTKVRGDLARPPMCELRWGNPKQTFFRGVLKSVTQNFTRFLEDGTPIRASLSCSFEEWETSTYKEKAKNPIDDPIRIVKQGETLSSIAAEEYGNAALWRVIADANRGLLRNPRQLIPGTALTVPPLRPTRNDQRR
jgi:hypothetical protein